MASLNNSRLISHISIAGQILEGIIRIESIEEFDSILELFPNDPELQRLYSDMLLKHDRPDDAAESYAKAAEMYMDSRMMLQAVVSKSLQWKINPPSHLNDVRDFLTMLQKVKFPKLPVNVFLTKLLYPAMLAILNSLVIVRIPRGKIIKKHGEKEENLFFVVSGTLAETAFVPVTAEPEILYKKTISDLFENDFFGTIYPFEEDHVSTSYIETTSQAELIKIHMSNLVKICSKYPGAEPCIIELYRLRADPGHSNTVEAYRKGKRHHLPAKIRLQILSDGDRDHPLMIEGLSRDISIGGICVFVDPTGQNIPDLSKAVQNAPTQISLTNEAMTLTISGTIHWCKEIILGPNKNIALGIKFKEMSPKLRGMMFAFVDSIYRLN